MSKIRFGKLSVIVPAWLKSLNRCVGPGSNRDATATAKPAKVPQIQHVFLSRQNKLMAGIALVLILATCHQVFWSLGAMPKANNSPRRALKTSSQATRSLPALEHYLKMARKRELFRPSVPLPAEKKLGQTTAEELAKRFKFLGVSGTKPNLSALVAVAKAGVKTVRQGERLEDFVVKEISSGQLTLELNEDIVVLKR